MPIIMLLKAETKIVAVSTPENGMPVLLMIYGFTMIMYIVARKVVIPAIVSVLRDDSFFFSSKRSFIFSPAVN